MSTKHSAPEVQLAAAKKNWYKKATGSCSVAFLSHLEGPEASWLLPSAVHRNHGPVLQACSGGIVWLFVQQTLKQIQ